MRSREAMPWVVGDETSYRIVETGSELAPSDLWSGRPCLYFGYLLEGFRADLERQRVQPARMPLAFRAGWSAVAITARVQEPSSLALPVDTRADPGLSARLGPYLAPATPRPYGAAPLGFTLFHRERVAPRIDAERRLLCMEWAERLQAIISPDEPVFCDPILEMNLSQLREDESLACRYRHPSSWRILTSALWALSGAER